MAASLVSRGGGRYWMCAINFAVEVVYDSDLLQPCQTVPEFGGGTCDPDTMDVDAFYWINMIRQHPDNPDVLEALQTLIDFCDGSNISILDFNDDNEMEVRQFVDCTNNPQDAIDLLAAQTTA